MCSDFREVVIVDVIDNIVNSIRETGTIITSVESPVGTYTCQSVNGLSSNDVIMINSIDYVIVSATSTEIVFEAETGIEFEGEAWSAKAPYYFYGHISEIVDKLSELTNGGILAYQKYPLIALFNDFEERKFEGGKSASLNLIIANLTIPTYVAKDRYDNNFKPVLYPLLYNFEKALLKSKSVETINFEYTKIDRLFWGKEGLYKNEGNIFNDFIDAIEINNLELKFKNNCL